MRALYQGTAVQPLVALAWCCSGATTVLDTSAPGKANPQYKRRLLVCGHVEWQVQMRYGQDLLYNRDHLYNRPAQVLAFWEVQLYVVARHQCASIEYSTWHTAVPNG